MHETYDQEIDECFQQALGLLRGEQRSLLRMHFIEGLSSPQVAKLFQVHRRTATRWLQEARFELYDLTQRLLRQRLRISDSQFQDLTGVVLSRLDTSIAKYLKE